MPIPTAGSGVPRQLLRDTVRANLRTAIFNGTIEPGERLHDNVISAWLDASRTPVREALTDLHRAGLIDMKPNKYTALIHPTLDDGNDAITGLHLMAQALANTDDDLALLTGLIDPLPGNTDPAASDALAEAVQDVGTRCGSTHFAQALSLTLDGLLYRARFAAPTHQH